MKRYLLVALFISVSLVLFAGGGAETEPVAPPSDLSSPADAVTSASFGNAALFWEVKGDEIIFTLQGKTTGWVAVGFDPSRAMLDAQYILAFVKDGVVMIRDDYGNGMFTHAPDTSAGGVDNVRLISGKETDEWTEVVFAIPRNSGDPYDVPLTSERDHTVIIAYGPSGRDDFSSKHVFKKSFTARF